LQELCQVLALSSEELAMRSGISTVLWERGVSDIKVIEAGLDDIITVEKTGKETEGRKTAALAGKTLVLSDVKNDPEGFGAGMTAFAIRTRSEHESVEDRLLDLYHQAGLKILKDHANESEALFEGLAKSVLALEPPHRECFVAGKLYGGLDAEMGPGLNSGEQQLPNLLHEVQAGRFSKAWTVQQVATLLKRTAAKKLPSPAPVPARLHATPVSRDLIDIARSLEQESKEQLAALQAISSAGMESDIIGAATRTLIFLIPLVKNPLRTGRTKKDTVLFSGVVQQLEDMLSYLLRKNNYELATIIIEALHMPVDPEFKPRMMEALKKTVTKSIIKETVADMKKYPAGSPEYSAAYAYLTSLDRKAIEVLLELLADENDRHARLYLLDLLKEFGKNQTALLGERLSDERWFVVRNIVSILGESKTDQAIMMLRKAADHKNIKIRQEVIKGLVSFGGRKAAGLLAKFLRDQDRSIQLIAANAFSELPGITADETKWLIEFLEEQPLKKKNQELALAVIQTLGKIGSWDAAEFLKRYFRIQWWKSRKLQVKLRDAAKRSLEEIMRREAHGGRAKR
jgi:hypothetical protein